MLLWAGSSPLASLIVNVPVEALSGPQASLYHKISTESIGVGSKHKNDYADWMLKLESITRRYTDGEPVTAVDNVTVEIKKGEYIAVVGPSGCGKSTLLYVIGLLDEPDGGSYYIDQQRVDRYSSKERARLRNGKFGFVFQSFNLLPRTTVYDNVMLPLQYGRASQAKEKVERAIRDVGLWDKRHNWPNQLSGGQQQRVAIARALVNNPEVILADEPTGNLDSKTGHEIMELFRQIHRLGTTIIMVTHNTELLSQANRVISMRDGQIEKDSKN